MNRKAILTSIALSTLFTVVYTGTNWVTSLRADVGSAATAWERAGGIPFIPWMILPYMSIDAFFIASPFFCKSDRERRTLALRLASAILIAGACFLLFPLRLAIARPPVTGWPSLLFDSFCRFDRPFNLCPSLHIALGLILALFFAARLKGAWRSALIVWFLLIGISALTTYQHHLIDIAGGLALAAICTHLFQDESFQRPTDPNTRIGLRYLVGALLLTAAAFIARPWTLLLLWPAFSLALVAAGYLLLGPRIYRKRNGHLPLTTWLLLWPVLIGQRLSLLWYARQADPWNTLEKSVLIGRKLNASEAQRAIDAGVTAVIDTAGEFAQAAPFRAIPCCELAVLDLTAPAPDQIDRALAFIEHHAAAGGKVYIHCKAGYSRTAVIAGAHMLRTGRAGTAAEAVTLLRTARPAIVVRPEAIAALERVHRSLPPPRPQ